ncbi:caspase family protein [Streptomyces sp. NPDC046203]|uniref:caspase, EACC1-associated type n=1 Tax=Streptomyces sp. NPDC046203 TaxID=3154602 RepID=UPI0033C60992
MPEPWGDLAGADCHAVVVGTGRQGAGEAASRLADLPSAASTARALARVLRERCGMADRVTEVVDPEGPAEVLTAVRAAVERAGGGTVLFFFSGHGLLGPRGRLYLATAGTARADDTISAVPYTEVRDLLGDAAASAVVVLDCCFSGRAATVPSDAHRDPYATARPPGSFLLASSTGYSASFAPAGEPYTLFGGELISLLEEGDPSGPPWLTLLDVYRLLDRRFQGGPARPYADGVGLAADLVLTRNAGYLAATAASGTEGAEEAEGTEGATGGPCPYPGMLPFLPEQHPLFFGREELTARLLDQVENGDEPVVLVGASGAGKSSLLRAGLVAGLQERGAGRVLLLPGPGARPFRALADLWARAVGRPFAEVEQELGAGRFTGSGPEVLVVDQLEEIFTDCDDPEERELFIRAVSGARRPDGAPRLVLGLRADFYGPCLRDPRLARIVREGQFTVPAMSDDELRAVIEQPAAHAGLRLETGLADHLLHELRRETVAERDTVALPFLAHALQQTWARRRGTLLTFAGYEASGGIRGSVARVADELYDALDEPGRARLRELVLRMVTLVDTEGRAARRRLPIPEPEPAPDTFPEPDSEPDARTAPDPVALTDRALLGRLADARLVVLDRGEAQLCHDSLLYGWPRLREWIRDDRVRLHILRRLGDAADSWTEAGRQNSGLYGGEQLATSRTLLLDPEAPATRLRPVEREFLQASRRVERRKRSVFLGAFTLVTALAVLATLLGFRANSARQDAQSRETVAVANELATQADIMRERDPQTALRLSLAAYRTADTTRTRSSLYSAYTTVTPTNLPSDMHEPVLNVAYGTAGALLASSQRGGAIRLWDVSRPNAPKRVAKLDLKGSAPIAFHPRLPLLAALSPAKLMLWNVSDPTRPSMAAAVSLPENRSFSLAFSPDGRTLAAGGESGRLRLWDVSEPSRPRPLFDRTLGHATLWAVEFNRDGRFLATGSGTDPDDEGTGPTAEVRLWDVHDPAGPTGPVELARAAAHSVLALAFHPKRDLLIATGGAGAMAWWTVERDGRRLAPVPGDPADKRWSGGTLPSLSFRPDGKLLAAARSSVGRDAWIRAVAERDGPELWSQDAERASVQGQDPSQAVAYSPDGSRLAVGDTAGTVRLWPEQPPAFGLRGLVAFGEPGAKPYTPDGRFVLTNEALRSPQAGSVARIWDLSAVDTARGKGPALRFTVPRPWEAKYFLPGRDRPMLLAHRWVESSRDHFFRVWDLGGTGPPVPGAEIRVQAPENVRTAVSRDGKLLITGNSTAPETGVWDLRDPLRPKRRATITTMPSSNYQSLFFMGPTTLATMEDDAFGLPVNLRLWDLTDPARPNRLPTPLRNVADGQLLYLPALRLLFTDLGGQNAEIWDMKDIRRPRHLGELPSAPGGYTPVSDRLMATMFRDGTVQLWDIQKPREPLHTMRFDRPIDTVVPDPDAKRVLTSSPYRVWDVAEDGTWKTPAIAELDVGDAWLLPGEIPYLLVAPDTSLFSRHAAYTYLLDRDPSKIYDRLCATHPLSVDDKQWKALFPHLEPHPSCPDSGAHP